MRNVWVKLGLTAVLAVSGASLNAVAWAQGERVDRAERVDRGERVYSDERVYTEEERYGTWEVALHIDRLGSQPITGLTSAALNVDSSAAWGASIAYNLNNHWSFGLEMLNATPDYAPVLGGEEPAAPGRYEMDISSTLFKATWHAREEGLTPYLSVGAGWTYLDSNIASGRPRDNCWYDPWWGYYCSSYFPTYDDTRTTLSASVGLRWDFHKRFFARANYGKMWIGVDDDDSSPAVAGLAIGFRH